MRPGTFAQPPSHAIAVIDFASPTGTLGHLIRPAGRVKCCATPFSSLLDRALLPARVEEYRF
jgi:hypothetical protein